MNLIITNILIVAALLIISINLGTTIAESTGKLAALVASMAEQITKGA